MRRTEMPDDSNRGKTTDVFLSSALEIRTYVVAYSQRTMSGIQLEQ
jgi:hypothetical protein